MKKPSLFEKIFAFANKNKYSKENQKAAEESIQSLRSRMDILCQKAQNLEDTYAEQRTQIEECAKTFSAIEPSASVRAGKFEQQIAVAITSVSSELDKIFTTKNPKALNSEIKLLVRVIRERQNADIPQDE